LNPGKFPVQDFGDDGGDDKGKTPQIGVAKSPAIRKLQDEDFGNVVNNNNNNKTDTSGVSKSPSITRTNSREIVEV
jgi:hypothetical protein